jgi:predicted transcriptional regulator of viral defense system
MRHETRNTTLRLVNDLVADGKVHFTFAEAQQRFGRSPPATGNLLQRMLVAGLIDRVRRGHYVVRQLGVLGTPSVAEEVALAVGAAFAGIPHRMAYRTALDEHDLIVHPARSVYVATPERIRAKTLSGKPLHIVREPESSISVGAVACGLSWVSGIERALLDAAMRPNLVGGAAVLAEAIAAAGNRMDATALTHYAQDLGWAAALRRIGSIADTLEVEGLAGRLHPLRPLTADLDLEPGVNMPRAWRDARWRVRWPQSPAEIASVAKQ